MQPSVIWIGDAEKMFYKKVPRDEKEVRNVYNVTYVLLFLWDRSNCFNGFTQLDPKRLKKDLNKILKSIRGEDCVLIVGTTNDPQSAELKSFCKFYNKIILIPRPDYASRYGKQIYKIVFNVRLFCHYYVSSQTSVCFHSDMERADKKEWWRSDQRSGSQLSGKDL